MKMYMLINLGDEICELFKYEIVELTELLNFESKVKMTTGLIATVCNQNLFMTLKDAVENVKERTGV